MRWIVIVSLLLALACSKGKNETPTAPEPTSAAPVETEAATEAAPQPETAAADTPLQQAELPPELQGPTPSPSKPPSLKVLEPGGEPTRQLRWSVKPGFEQTLSMKVRFQIEALIGGLVTAKAAWRSAVYKIRLKAEEVESDGALRVAFTIDELNAEYEEGANAAQVDRLEEAVAQVRGSRGRYTIDSRGWVKKVELEPPPDALQEAEGMVDDLKWALHQMTPSFPEEPIGEGAKWTVHRGVMQEGALVNQLSTMNIIKLQGTRVSVRTKLQQSAQAQTFKQRSWPQSTELLELVAEGDGEVRWDLTKLAPRTASVSSTMAKVYRFKGDPNTILGTISRSLTIPAK